MRNESDALSVINVNGVSYEKRITEITLQVDDFSLVVERVCSVIDYEKAREYGSQPGVIFRVTDKKLSDGAFLEGSCAPLRNSNISIGIKDFDGDASASFEPVRSLDLTIRSHFNNESPAFGEFYFGGGVEKASCSINLQYEVMEKVINSLYSFRTPSIFVKIAVDTYSNYSIFGNDAIFKGDTVFIVLGVEVRESFFLKDKDR